MKILILILIIVGLLASIYLVGQRTGFFSQADISSTPVNIKVSNIADNSFTVSWITNKETPGFIKYGESNNLTNLVFDDRDSSSPKSRSTHHLTLKNLDPNKTYYYQINNQGTILTQTTAPVTADPPAVPEPIFGKIVKVDGKVPFETLVYLENSNGSILSSYTRDDGNYLITLNNARTKDLAKYLDVKSTDPVTISIDGGQDGTFKVQAKISEREVFSKITLTNPQAPNQNRVVSGVQDFNGDGVINVFDYLIYIKQKI